MMKLPPCLHHVTPTLASSKSWKFPAHFGLIQPRGLNVTLAEVAMQVTERNNDWPGVDIEIDSVREYPTGENTAELIGF